MISKDDIERIKLEEQLRAEIRNSSSQSQKKSLWYYLNSSFGLWFLSTIAVGLLSYGYSMVNERIDQNRRRNNQISRLDLEIEGRIYQLQTIKKRSVNSTTSFVDSPSQFNDFWIEFKQAPIYSYSGFSSVYQEFDERTIISLIVELSSLLESEKEKKNLKRITQKIIFNELVPVKINIDEEQNVLLNIVNELRIKRWQKNWPIN